MGIISPGKVLWGGFCHPWNSQSPTASRTPERASPCTVSEADTFANQMATESSISSQHLKESAVPNTCPTLRTHRMQCQWHLHCTADPPKLHQGKIPPPSLQT